MRRESREFLVRLLDVPAPTGFEMPAQRIWREAVEPHAGRVEVDVYGNHTAVLDGTDEISVMVAGHADEVGLIIRRIDPSGMLRFGRIGGLDTAVLPGTRVRVLVGGKEIPGVIGRPAIHLIKPEDRRKAVKPEDLCIDIGARDGKAAGRLVSVGDPVIFGEDFQDLAGGFASHRAFDNRMGCFVVAEMVRLLSRRRHRATVYAVSTVQEETGVWGAGLVAERYRPSLGIAVDVTHDTTTPGIPSASHADTACGKGPVLCRGVRSSRVVTGLLEKTARAAKIPFQIEVDEGATGTDADAMSWRGTGVPVNTVSVACRYMHTPAEVIHLDDLSRTASLLAKFVSGLSDRTDLVPR